jgi:hypothetical protein
VLVEDLDRRFSIFNKWYFSLEFQSKHCLVDRESCNSMKWTWIYMHILIRLYIGSSDEELW